MNDWENFLAAVPWFVDRAAAVELFRQHEPRRLAPSSVQLFPSLAKLLATALRTDVSVNGARYELLAWDSHDGDRFGWLCEPPARIVPNNLHEDHRALLASFGGIVERFNEPEDTWLLNLNVALTKREAAHDASFIENYMWAFEDAGLTLPIDPSNYYSIAREANGNTTLCHRESGHVLLFAPDHCFTHLTKLEGCPEYTLYEISGAATFRDWVNAVAAQWLSHAATAT